LQHKDWLQHLPTPLTKQRKELLDKFGFVWQVRNRPDWSSKYDELVAYKEKHGNTVSQAVLFGLEIFICRSKLTTLASVLASTTALLQK
jgi:hypothetical protein